MKVVKMINWSLGCPGTLECIRNRGAIIKFLGIRTSALPIQVGVLGSLSL